MAKTDIKFEVVSEVPSITRPSTNSKYRPIVDAAVENEGQAIKVPFGDNKTAHSRAGSVRSITTRHEDADNFTVVVRGSDLYVTYGGGEPAEEEPEELTEADLEDETEVEETPAPAKKKATRKRTAARKRS